MYFPTADTRVLVEVPDPSFALFPSVSLYQMNVGRGLAITDISMVTLPPTSALTSLLKGSLWSSFGEPEVHWMIKVIIFDDVKRS